MTKLYSLDACALITYLREEEGFEIIRDLFEEAESRKISLTISIANVTEVLYDLMRTKTPFTELTAILQDIRSLPIAIVHTISDEAAIEAARLKVTYRIALADVFGLAVAKELGAVFVTSDHAEMEQIEQHEPISFHWLPAKRNNKRN